MRKILTNFAHFVYSVYSAFAVITDQGSNTILLYAYCTAIRRKSNSIPLLVFNIFNKDCAGRAS